MGTGLEGERKQSVFVNVCCDGLRAAVCIAALEQRLTNTARKTLFARYTLVATGVLPGFVHMVL